MPCFWRLSLQFSKYSAVLSILELYFRFYFVQQTHVKYAILIEDIYISHSLPGIWCIDIISTCVSPKAAGKSHHPPPSSHLRAALLAEAANVTRILGTIFTSLRGETKCEVDCECKVLWGTLLRQQEGEKKARNLPCSKQWMEMSCELPGAIILKH